MLVILCLTGMEYQYNYALDMRSDPAAMFDLQAVSPNFRRTACHENSVY